MSIAPKQVRLSLEELNQVKQLLGALLAILSIWSLASLEVNSEFVLVLAGITSVLAFLFPKWVARIPLLVWRWAGPVILLLIGADFILHLPEFIAPLVRMVVLLVLYRLLAPRNQREDLQVILLCLFCVVISGVLTVSLLFAFQILLFAPLAMALLFVICLLDRGQDTEVHVLNWDTFKWSRFLERVWQVLDFRILLLCSSMFALVVAISSLFFILTPRFDLNRAIPFLEIKTSARSGFSESVRLGEVSEIQQDNSVALRIDVPSLDAVNVSPYWRMLILDKYNLGGFRVSPSLLSRPLRVFEKTLEKRSANVATPEQAGALWTFYMEGGISRYLPLPGDFTRLRFPKYQNLETIPDLHLLAVDSVGQNVFSYQIEGLKFNQRFSAGASERDILGAMPLEVESQPGLAYPFTTLELDLSMDSIETLQQINHSIVADVDLSAVAYSQAVCEYLSRHFSYSLRPDGYHFDEEDPVISWLKHGSQGHCELFAGAFLLLARAGGYPARMVVGYVGGSWNAVEDYYVVRNRDAHAWVEIYDVEDQSWLRVDPTPGGSEGGVEAAVSREMRIESDWGAWVDSLRIQWYRRIVSFEQKDQVELVFTLKDVLRGYYFDVKEQLKRVSDAVRFWIARPFYLKDLRPIALGLVLAGIFYFGWRLRYHLLSLFFRLMRQPTELDPARLRARRYLQRMESKGLDSDVVAELKAIRFGPVCSMRQAKPVFVRARFALKHSKDI
jgi:hypothetical protein